MTVKRKTVRETQDNPDTGRQGLDLDAEMNKMNEMMQFSTFKEKAKWTSWNRKINT